MGYGGRMHAAFDEAQGFGQQPHKNKWQAGDDGADEVRVGRIPEAKRWAR